MDGLRDVLSRLATRKSRARKKAERGHANRRFRFQRIEPLEERHMLSATAAGLLCTTSDLSALSGAAAAASDLPAASDYDLTETFSLHSLSTSSMKIYLDFDGSITTGTIWNDDYDLANIITPAYSIDEDAAFSETELTNIQKIWQRVAEDFLPFDVDVTTEDPGTEALQNLPLGSDSAWGIRIVIGGTSDWMDETWGCYAYLGAFNWPSDTPEFAFSGSDWIDGDPNWTADMVSWVTGMSLGLSRDGDSTHIDYPGHGTGDTSWGPIMGAPHSCSLTQWSKGEYPNANNTQDDLALITGRYTNEYGTNGITYRNDAVGNTTETATAITMSSRIAGSAEGIIERNTDTDVYSFATGPGAITITINPAEVGANLDILATLYDSEGNVIETSNPVDELNASFTRTVTLEEAGTYYVSVQGTGKEAIEGDPGYSNYGSLGYYSITASVQPVYQVLVTPSTVMETTEAGGTATFTMRLTAAPTSSVTVPLSSGDITEGTLSVANAIFTTANWSTLQTITVTGANDLTDDGDVTYTILTGNCQSNDANYRSYNFDDVTVTNVDDDEAGFTFTPASGLVTSESGAKTTFTVVTRCEPTASVTLGLTTSNASEGTASVSSLTFTTTNWDVPQTVTVTGVDDSVVDGPTLYTIKTDKPTSTDRAFSNLTAAEVPDISVTNLDNDPGYILALPSELTTEEDGTPVTFTVMPSLEPTANVTLTLTSSDTTEGQLVASTFVFTPSNWSTPQTVTVTGVDDDVDDDDVPYEITGVGTSADPRLAVAMDTVSLLNIDDDDRGFTVSPISGDTSEQAARATFTVRLTSRPLADVSLPIESGDPTEGTLVVTNLVFTSADWNVPQTVTVAGVNDDYDDGDVDYSIETGDPTSIDTTYDELDSGDVADVDVTNLDDDTAGVILSRTAGLLTDENGSTDTFTVRLATRPSGLVSTTVVINLSSDNTAEGTVSPTSLTFTTTNWSTPQTVTVTGKDDSNADGNAIYNVITAVPVSTDPNYSGLTDPEDVPDVQVTNLDNDAAGLKFTPTGSMRTNEAGTLTASFTVQLLSTPTDDVTVDLAVLAQSDGRFEGALSVSSLTFTSGNWNIAQTVTVTGLDDDLLDGNTVYGIKPTITSADAVYAALTPVNLSVTNVDNDTASVVVTPTSGLTTTEAGGTATFTLALNHAPTADVNIYLYSNDTSEGTISANLVTFTTGNWNIPQTVTVTGMDDPMTDGNIAYAVVVTAAGSADPHWNAVDGSDVSVTNTDNDAASVLVAPTSLEINENLGTATFTIVLTSQPLGTYVNISLTSDDPGEGTVSVDWVRFDQTNWNVAQTVTVTGQHDWVIDGDQTFQITTGAAASDGADYKSKTVADVTVTNLDTDTARVVITPVSGLTTTEGGGTAVFTVTLASKPVSSQANPTVSFTFSVNDTTEATLDTAIPTNVTRIARGTGVNASVATVTCATAPGLAVGDLVIISGADQSAYNGTFRVTSVNTTLNTFTYRVTGTPGPSSNGGMTATKTGLTFTTDNWNVPQTVTVTGLDDEYQDGDVDYKVVTGTCFTNTTTDPYSNLAVDDVSLTNIDNDRIEIRRLATGDMTTTETNGTATFEVWLGSKPSANVSVHFTSSDTTEGKVLTTDLTWTPSEWQTRRTVTIEGVDDDIDDGNVAYAIQGVTTSADTTYDDAARAIAGLSAAMTDMPAVNNDDADTAGITVVAAPDLVTHEWGSTVTFTVRLTSEPVGSVVVPITSNDSNEGLPSPASLTFTAANWQVEQTVTVTGQDDKTPDGPATYQITVGPTTSAEAVYNTGLIRAAFSLTNQNDAPVANSDTYATAVDIVLVVADPGVLLNDTDDGPLAQLSAIAVSDPAYGTLTLNSNGGFTYTPQAHFAGTDQFLYQLSDGQESTKQTTVTITVGTGTGLVRIELPTKLWESQTGSGTVSRLAGDSTATDLIVYLTTPESDQVTTPESVIIRAGQTSATFDIVAIDDSLYNGARSVEIWASASGYWSNHKSMEIGDNDVDHFSFTSIDGPQTAGVAFSTALWARDINDETIQSYTGTCLISAANSAGAVPLTTDSLVVLNGKASFNATVNAVATGVYLVASDGNGHTGSSNTFDVVHGDLKYFAWTSDPLSNQQVATPFLASVAACDTNGYQVANYTGAVELTGWVSTGATSSLVITEISDKNGYDLATNAISDYIELENVGTSTVNTWNWKLLANNPDLGLAAYQTCSLSTVLAMAPGDTVMFSDSSADADLYDDDYYFGSPLYWGQGTSKGWVMLVDQNDTLVDFVAWGYTEVEIKTLAVTLESNTLKPIADSDWHGAGVTYDRTMGASLQRTGSHDRDVADDFAWTTISVTRPQENSGLTTVFEGVLRPIGVSPATVTLVGGVWSGRISVSEQVENMFLQIEGEGLTADSQTFTVGVSQASALASTPALVNPASAVFYIKYTNSGGYADAAYGYGAADSGWIALAGDWNGDGVTTVGMYDPASSCFYLTNSTSGGYAQIAFGFGQANAGWLPLVGDWNGDNIDTVGLFDPTSSCFLLTNTNASGFADISFGYGSPKAGWTPISGDWDGDGVDGVGLYATSASTFYLRNSNTTGMANYTVAFGQGGAGWKPLIGDWNADGKDTIAVYDPASGVFYERDSNTSGFAEHVFGFGETNSGWMPLAGDWNGADALNVATLGTANVTTTLTTADVAGVLDAAMDQWTALGLDSSILEELANVQIVVTDLPGTALGLADGNHIYLDSTAAGYGWFVDVTPAENEEFSTDGQLQAIDPAALDRVDLLSVVAHELGHVAGLEHLDSGLMEATLEAGLRRVAGLAERDALFAFGLGDNED